MDKKVEEGFMPTYEYQCRECNNEFVEVLSIAEHDKEKVICPKCKSEKTFQLVSTFLTKTSRKS
jgi:putative FmdB family regulatory protein